MARSLPFAATVLILLLVPILGAQEDDCSVELSVTCSATDGLWYPVTIEWESDDPDLEYDTIEVFENGELLFTLDGGDTELTHSFGAGGQRLYRVLAYDAGDCVARSDDCYAAIALLETCATDRGEAALELDSDTGVLESSMSLEHICDLQRMDGTTDDDQSPTEDDRVDIDELTVRVEVTSLEVGALELTITSPEGTSIGLWNEDGGAVEWDLQAVLFSDFGILIPDPVPDTCDDCVYLPSGPGELSDLFGEDATGDWTLEAESSADATVHDWCVALLPDELTTAEDRYIRGDVDGNGSLSAIIDAFRILQWGFGDADEPPCLMAADTNGDGRLTILVDAIYLLFHFFGDGDPPPAPFPSCGSADPGYEQDACDDEDGLDCLIPPFC